MKTTLLIVRHGESLGNRDERFLGHTDLGLSELGHRQAAALGVALRGRRIDAVYSSDLCRAADTVAPAAADRDLPIVTRRDLREIYAGDWEGRRFDDILTVWPEERAVWKTDIGHACPPNGERVSNLYERAFSAITAIAAENPGRTVLIGTHATPVRAITARLMGLGLAGMADIPWAPNASITTVVFEDGIATLVGEADASHLADLVNEVPKKI
jgi:broad specificity phosphatase PhoE